MAKVGRMNPDLYYWVWYGRLGLARLQRMQQGLIIYAINNSKISGHAR